MVFADADACGVPETAGGAVAPVIGGWAAGQTATERFPLCDHFAINGTQKYNATGIIIANTAHFRGLRRISLVTNSRNFASFTKLTRRRL